MKKFFAWVKCLFDTEYSVDWSRVPADCNWVTCEPRGIYAWKAKPYLFPNEEFPDIKPGWNTGECILSFVDRDAIIGRIPRDWRSSLRERPAGE
jgi:hypothetical protein